MSSDRVDDGVREARYRAVFAEVYPKLLAFARRRADPAYVDDVVADTLLVAWRRLDEVPAGGELPWCYAVARRCLANQQRSEARRLGLVQRLGATAVSTAGEAWESEDSGLNAAMADLPQEDRVVLELWAWEDLAPREIATVLGISANAASIRLHRAKRRLRSLLSDGKEPGAAGQRTGGHEREQR
ncbi:MAG TPA: sigma-70 family RNA polymerase sigma factor [Mycobacteriales bacterium]|nr:sigma-70 family RNA polymerase sigma factor [Mycobacteriales bacterium]